MKIADYNQMMAYLTRPEPLPQPKPEELLDLQEQKRKDRLRKTMEEIGSGLMDESVDFIERENFAIKGLTDQQLLNLGFDTRQIKMQKKSYERLAEIFQKADIENDLEYLFETGNKKYPKGQVEGTLRNILNKLPEDEKGLRYIASLLGEDVEFVLDMIDDKTTLADELRTGSIMSARAEKGGNLRKEFSKVEEWMLKNGSKYSDPDKFKKATINRFGKKNPAIKALTSGGTNLFSTDFNQNILGYDQLSNFAKLNKTIGDNVFRTVIYNFNPKVRKAITNEFDKILSGGPAIVKKEARKRIQDSKLFKQFGLTTRIHGPISRLIYKEVGEELYKNLQTFRNPQIGTVNFIKYLEGVVDPKYKSQFKEARIAMEAAGKNELKKAKEILGRTDKIMFDHKIPSSFIDAGYADPIEYIKVTPATENFNKKIKNTQYDQPINKLLRKFEKAKTSEAKEVIYNTILKKHNDFSTKYGGYLDNVKPSFKDGKIKFSSAAAPVTKQTDFVKEFAKAGLQTGELKTKDASKITKLIASIACPGKAMGGRIGFQDGTSCFEKGKKMINTGRIPEGAGQRNFIKFANKAAEIGKQTGRGLRTFTKFGILPEAIFIGADTAIRAGMGDTFDEAFKRATDIYRTDGSYEQADALELKRIDPANADTILNLRNFYNEQAKLSSLEQQKESELALAGTEFAETNIGETEEEIEKRYAPLLQKQENNLFNATISDAEERAGLAKEAEFADKKGVAYKKSPVGKVLDIYAEAPSIKPIVDYFATEARGEPDVSAQVLQNYFEGKLDSDESKNLQNIIRSDKAKGVLDAIKKIEAAEPSTEDEPSIFDEERKILFDLAKTDTALAERLFGPGMTFAGDSIDSTDLQDEMNLDRGIYALGGRIGFAKGPMDPSRRYFMKVMAGIMSIPVVGKFLKPAAKVVPVVQDGVKLGVDKLMLLVNKIRNLGTDVTPKLSTNERERVLTYEGKDGSEYELYEDLTTGDIRVERNKTGVGSDGERTFDTIEDKTTFEIKKGEEIVKDEGMETQKTIQGPDEYEEGKAIFDQDGTVSDFDEVDDSTIKAIEDEIN